MRAMEPELTPAMSSSRSSRGSRFRPDIQGLRAVAVALVLLDHAGIPGVSGGFVGVDVFFVISGFLISGHLFHVIRRSGRIDLVAFYAARARRILPAALVTIAVTAVASFLLVSPLRIEEILRDGIAAAVFAPNVLFAIKQTDYLAGTAPSPFQHLWSLGVEEQFYLIWPLLLLGLFLLLRRSHRGLMVGIAAVAVASFLASVLVTPQSPSLAFFSPHTRAWEFAVGALVAGAAPALARLPALLAPLLSWVGLGLILLCAMTYSAQTVFPGSAALLPVVGTAMVIGCGRRGLQGELPGAAAVLGLRPFQLVGALSYSLYLVHWPIIVLTHERLGLNEPLPVSLGILLIALSVPIAWCLHRFIETPFRAVGAERPRRRSLVWAAAGSLLLVCALLLGGVAAARLPLSASQTEAGGPPVESPSGTAFVPANMAPSLADAGDDAGSIYTNGCQQGLSGSEVLSCSFGDLRSSKTIALFGDSHAGRWFPAVEQSAKDLGFRLDTYTKSGCRSEDTVAAWDDSVNLSCSQWRNAVLGELTAAPPEVIILASHLGPRPVRAAAAQEQEWTEGLLAGFDRLPSSSRIVMLADSPEFASSPVLCLSTHLTEARACAMPRSAAFNPSIRAAQFAAAAEYGATVLDLSDYFCNDSSCPAVIGRTLVYSDEHHLTATFSRSLAPVLREKLAVALDGAGSSVGAVGRRGISERTEIDSLGARGRSILEDRHQF
jgi:peptidoglycan/LPS O-acetylase OafA/YrhL